MSTLASQARGSVSFLVAATINENMDTDRSPPTVPG